MRCLIPINIRGVQYGKGACGGTGGWGIALQSRKFAGSIPDGVIGIFHLHNPSGRTMALGLIQPLTEMSTRNISRETKVAGELGWQYYHLHVPIVSKSGSLNLLEPSGSVQACNGTALTLQYGNIFICRGCKSTDNWKSVLVILCTNAAFKCTIPVSISAGNTSKIQNLFRV